MFERHHWAHYTMERLPRDTRTPAHYLRVTPCPATAPLRVWEPPPPPGGARLITLYLVTAHRGRARRGRARFLGDFCDFSIPWWTIGANHRLVFLVYHPGTLKKFYCVIRWRWNACGSPKGSKMTHFPEIPQNRLLICSARSYFVTRRAIEFFQR